MHLDCGNPRNLTKTEQSEKKKITKFNRMQTRQEEHKNIMTMDSSIGSVRLFVASAGQRNNQRQSVSRSIKPRPNRALQPHSPAEHSVCSPLINEFTRGCTLKFSRKKCLPKVFFMRFDGKCIHLLEQQHRNK